MPSRTRGGLAIAGALLLASLSVSQLAAQEPTNAISDEFITLGYVQSTTASWGYHYHAMTHLAMTFTDFDANGNLVNPGSWTNRSILFRPGGKADRNGTKILLTIRNQDFSSSVMSSVMLDPAKRANLISKLVALVGNDPGCHGINFDFEPVPYGAGVGSAIVDFSHELRAAMPDKELSKYVGPTYSSTSWPNLPGLMEALDYVNISCYPYSGSWSATSRAIAPITQDGGSRGYRDNTDLFMQNGVPPNKMVLTLASYGYSMVTTSTAYGANKVSNLSSIGYTQGRFATSLGTPQRTRNYKTLQESLWYTTPRGVGEYNHYNYDDEFTIGLKIRGARNWHGNQYTGQRLRGVGFWSLAWMGPNFLGSYASTDLETGSTGVLKTRTYPMVYQELQETLSRPGTREFVLEKWEYDSASISASDRNRWDRWRDPKDSEDNIGVVSGQTGRSIVATPGSNKPPASNYCLQLSYGFTSDANSRLFYRWEILGDHVFTTTRDVFGAVGHVPANSTVKVSMLAPGAAGRSIRFVAMDAKGELETSKAFPLSAGTWTTLEWDLWDDSPGNILPYTTNHDQYLSGDGILDSAMVVDIDGDGTTTTDIVPARDIAVVGFLIESNGVSGNGLVYLDELRYSPGPREGRQYVINEFRYHDTTRQYIEIHGPAGPIPSGLQLRVATGASGAVTASIPVAGSIPDSGDGTGLLLIGTSSVPNRNITAANGFLNAVTPAGMQLIDTQTGYIHDAVTYRAYSGTGRLDGPRMALVTGNGYPWLGEANTGSGTVATDHYGFSRYPDGANTWINGADFGLAVPTPGSSNGGSIKEADLPVTFDFQTVPPGAFQTYQPFTLANPVTAGLPASPSGGLAHRSVDTGGGGVISFIGDRALGESGQGYRVTGEWFIPASNVGTPVQSVAVGFCGSQGTTFFTASPASSGFEDGYWLIYENRDGAALNDGRADHPGTFEFVMATNNGVSPAPVQFLGSATRASAGIGEGTWAPFELVIDPTVEPAGQLTAKINDTVVYDGPIPIGGPTRGAVQIGFRENHAGNPVASEGTWVDNLQISLLTPVEPQVDIFRVY
jgi:spore germination protein YaaH